MDFREVAREILHRGKTDKECFLHLQHQGFKQSYRTFKTCIALWREDPDFPKSKRSSGTEERDAAIAFLCRDSKITDADIAQRLQEQGIQITARTVKTHRLKLGFKHRNLSTDEQKVMYDQTLVAVRSEIQDGPARSYGRTLLTAQLRTKGLQARKDHITTALSQVLLEQDRPRAFAAREAKARLPFAEYYGPDYLWALDGHDKLKPFGIEIYAAIDAYSRYIVYCYVGVSNKTQVSVCKMYLQAISTSKWCPRLLRTDRGTEVPMMADAQHAFYKSYHQERSPTDFDATKYPMKDCVVFGKSTHNHRIESWWNGLEKAQLGLWRVGLCGVGQVQLANSANQGFNLWLRNQGFHDDSNSDSVVYLHTILPLIRQETFDYVEVWNEHNIRRQKERPNHVAGVPRKLYEQSQSKGNGQRPVPRRYGFPVPEDELRAWNSALDSFGKFELSR